MLAPNKVGKLKPGFEVVFTIRDYHDAPRSGVANFQGMPHFYECIFDEISDDYSNLYMLTPLDQEVFRAAIENWEIFLRWRKAFDSGELNRETHPALPQDKNRYEETKQILDRALASGRAIALRVRGDFDVLGDPNLPRDVLTQWQVKWSGS